MPSRCGSITSPPVQGQYVAVYPGEQEGGVLLTSSSHSIDCYDIVYAYSLNTSSAYSAFLDLDGMLEDTPNGDFIVLLGDFNAKFGNDSDTWKDVMGRNGLPNLNLSRVLLLDIVLVTVSP